MKGADCTFWQFLPKFSPTPAGAVGVRHVFLLVIFEKGGYVMHSKMRFRSRRERLFRLPLRHFFGNRKVKDRLFCYIFEKDKKALLELYNALNGTDYQDERALQVVTLENVVYMSMNNDLAFLLTDTLNLYEHQSTFCPNLPLRFLLYLAAEYEAITEKIGANIYGSTQITLPAPQCIVFYNGNRELEDESCLYLTDAFKDESGRKQESCLELKVRLLNINHGHNEQLMTGCRRLEEYACFVAEMRENQKAGFPMDEAVDNAVRYCIEHGILADILLPFRAEVKKMLLTEYDEKKTMRMFREEAWAAGRKEGIQIGKRDGMEKGLEKGQNQIIKRMAKNGASAEEIARLTDLPVEEIRKVCQE